MSPFIRLNAPTNKNRTVLSTGLPRNGRRRRRLSSPPALLSRSRFLSLPLPRRPLVAMVTAITHLLVIQVPVSLTEDVRSFNIGDPDKAGQRSVRP